MGVSIIKRGQSARVFVDWGCNRVLCILGERVGT